MALKILKCRVVRNSYRKANILKGYFTTEHAICNPKTSFTNFIK